MKIFTPDGGTMDFYVLLEELLAKNVSKVICTWSAAGQSDLLYGQDLTDLLIWMRKTDTGLREFSDYCFEIGREFTVTYS